MVKKYTLFAIALVCLILTFIGSPDTEYTRSLEYAWNLGHVVAYCLWTYLLITYFPLLMRCSWGYQWLATMTFALLFGIAVEYIQKNFLGRTADMDDVMKNLVGCSLALAFFAPRRKSALKIVVLVLQLIALLISMGEFLPLARAVTDELIADQQFPQLATFNTPFEMTRWKKNDARITIDRKIKYEGKASLRLDLEVDTYSGAFLKFFPRDWRNWSEISFRVYNPEALPIRMICRINDFDHNRNGYYREDRFNRKFTLKPGWNRIEYSLKDVENGPENRRMNMAEIESFAIYSFNLKKPQSIYLDDIRLNR